MTQTRPTPANFERLHGEEEQCARKRRRSRDRPFTETAALEADRLSIRVGEQVDAFVPAGCAPVTAVRGAFDHHGRDWLAKFYLGATGGL